MSLPQQITKTTDETKVIAQHAGTADEARTHIATIQKVMNDVMKREVHYGQIPGTDKPTLLKPGAEILCATFRIAPTYEVEDLSVFNEFGEPTVIRYAVVCRGVHQNTGILLGDGVGECSSLEEKYKWRWAPEREWEATPENRRRIKYAKRENQKDTKQVRTDPADQANTIRKMAAKRAQVAMSLNVLAASDMFAQDLEDSPPQYEQPRSEPQSTGQGSDVATEAQLRLIGVKADKAHVSIEKICSHFNLAEIVDLPKAKVNDVLAYIEDNSVPFE